MENLTKPAIIEIVIDNKNVGIFVCIYDFITDYSHRSAGTSYDIINFDFTTTYSEIYKSLASQYDTSSTKILFDVFH